MANHKSAKKRAKQNEVRRVQNKMKMSEVRTAIKEVRKSIENKDKENAGKLFVKAQSLLSRLAKSSAMTRNTASRLTSRLSIQVSKLA